MARSKNPVLLIDADILLHRAVSFVDREFDGEPVNDWRQAENFFDILLKKWLKEAGNYKDYYLVLSVGGNFRKGLYADYKANRKDIEPHPAFFDLKASVMDRLASIWEEGIEADDLIGIKATEDKDNTLVLSADKDFATVPVNLMIPTSHGRVKPDWKSFTEDEANMNWLRQTMTGDTIDNYKGIPGIGPAKAAKIIPAPAPIDVMWENVKQAFNNASLDEAEAIRMARLARILRKGDYDFETKEVKLWTPTNTSLPRASTTSPGSKTETS